MTDRTPFPPTPFPAESFSRRRLFEAGASALGLAAVLAGCGNDSGAAEPGRVGLAPVASELPDVEVNDIVFLRTLTSLEHTIVEVYGRLGEIDGLSEPVAAALERFTADHEAAAASFAELTAATGGEPYECANQWITNRAITPTLDAIFCGGDRAASDDPERDAVAFVNTLEKMSAASAQQYVERLTDPALRAAVMVNGVAASRRSAALTILTGEQPRVFVAPELVGGEVTEAADFPTPSAIEHRFGPLVPFELVVGSADELGLRYKRTYETPAENAYVYEGQTCPG
ncbi:hypothetical protein BH24ACT5_BH24ACT5_13170 [soil metagenome]